MIITVLSLLGCRRFKFIFVLQILQFKRILKETSSRGSVSLSPIPVGCLQLVWAELEKDTYTLLEYKLIPNFSKLNS